MAKAGRSGQWSWWCGNNRISTVTMWVCVSLSACVSACVLLAASIYHDKMCVLACRYHPRCCCQAAGQPHRETNSVCVWQSVCVRFKSSNSSAKGAITSLVQIQWLPAHQCTIFPLKALIKHRRLLRFWFLGLQCCYHWDRCDKDTQIHPFAVLFTSL